jgi:hypothetical protein
MSLHNAVQRVRKLFGLRNTYVVPARSGSGSVTVIPGAGDGDQPPVSLGLVRKYEQYKKYDPIPYNKFDLPMGTGRVTNYYNQLCKQVGLQSCVRMDPTDWKQIYDFVNVGKMLIRIRWFESKQQHEILLEPGERTTLKLGGNLDREAAYPEIKAFRYGDDDVHD